MQQQSNCAEWRVQVRVESTITESNGSSSMASVCGGCLAMLDAGAHVAASNHLKHLLACSFSESLTPCPLTLSALVSTPSSGLRARHSPSTVALIVYGGPLAWQSCEAVSRTSAGLPAQACL